LCHNKKGETRSKISILFLLYFFVKRGLTYRVPISIIYLSELKKGGERMSPKTGRPKSDNPKTNDIKVRIDDETHRKLLEHCKETGITKAEAVRQGIDLVLEKK